MKTSTYPPISITQGIATYLLLEDTQSIKQMGYFTRIINQNLLSAHKDFSLDIDAFQDALHDSEVKTWEYHTGWVEINNSEEQKNIDIHLSQNLPLLLAGSKELELSINVSAAILNSNEPEIGGIYTHTLNKVTKHLLTAYLLEKLDLQSLLDLLTVKINTPAFIS